jgi:general secretion pathway protein N
MKRAIWITLFAVVAFAVIVLARLPASWVIPSPPANISCTAVDGSIWSGTCAGLSVQGTSVGDVVWEVHPSQLLAGKLFAHVVLTRPSASARADVEVGLDKNITARNVQADLPLDPALIRQLPRNLRGSAHADLALARIEKGIVTQLQGRIEAYDLEERSGNVTKLGSYSLTFPGGSGDPTGQLRDLGGPLTVEGTVRLTREPGFDLQGFVTPHRDAPPELANEIQFLGSPDAQGRRQFALAATF